MERIPRKHELALLCRNVDETSLLTGHVMQRAIKVDAAMTKSFKKISGLKEEKKHLNQELNDVKEDFETLTASLEKLSESLKNVGADVEMVMQENNTLEKKNEEMKVEMEGVKSEKANLQMVFKKEKGERKKSDKELVRLTSKLDGLRSTQMEL
ncbi:hypothetical protein Dimus_010935 [Dionaea muscipula]